MRSAVIIILAAVGLSGLAVTVQAEVYKWTDQYGNVHYGDSPPSDQQSDSAVVDLPATPRNNTSGLRSGERELLEELSRQRKQAQREQARQQKAATRQAAREQQRRAKACENYRDRWLKAHKKFRSSSKKAYYRKKRFEYRQKVDEFCD